MQHVIKKWLFGKRKNEPKGPTGLFFDPYPSGEQTLKEELAGDPAATWTGYVQEHTGASLPRCGSKINHFLGATKQIFVRPITSLGTPSYTWSVDRPKGSSSWYLALPLTTHNHNPPPFLVWNVRSSPPPAPSSVSLGDATGRPASDGSLQPATFLGKHSLTPVKLQSVLVLCVSFFVSEFLGLFALRDLDHQIVSMRRTSKLWKEILEDWHNRRNQKMCLLKLEKNLCKNRRITSTTKTATSESHQKHP